jgi:glycine betaine/proline transport system substrate-binding protein
MMRMGLGKSLGFVLAFMMFVVACGNLPGRRGSLPGDGKTIRMGQATWDTGLFQAQVFKVLLEELGYTVKAPETVDTIAFYFFSAQRDLDFWANGWFPLHERYLEFEDVAGKVEPVGFQVEKGALQGYMVDKATAIELGITNLGDLQDPEIAAVFDTDGDGKADLIGCSVGWGCKLVIDNQLNALELHDTVTHVQGDYTQLMEETLARYEQGQPVLFYTWTPNWTISAMAPGEDVMWLGVPFSALSAEPNPETEASSILGCLENPCNMGFEPSDIRVVANSKFLGENPAAATLFELVEIPLADIANQNVRMSDGENSEEEIRFHAEEWIEANREQVDLWLEAARSAAQ